MIDLLFSAYGLFGLAGLAGIVGLGYVAPGVFVSIGLRILDAGVRVCQYGLEKISVGGPVIFGNHAATFTFCVGIIVAGIVGDKLDPWKWVKSAAWEAVRPEVDRPEPNARSKPKPRAVVKRSPLGAAWDDIKCALPSAGCEH